MQAAIVTGLGNASTAFVKAKEPHASNWALIRQRVLVVPVSVSKSYVTIEMVENTGFAGEKGRAALHRFAEINPDSAAGNMETITAIAMGREMITEEGGNPEIAGSSGMTDGEALIAGFGIFITTGLARVVL